MSLLLTCSVFAFKPNRESTQNSVRPSLKLGRVSTQTRHGRFAFLPQAPTGADNDLTDNWRKATAALAPSRWPDLRTGIQLSIAHQRTLLSQVRPRRISLSRWPDLRTGIQLSIAHQRTLLSQVRPRRIAVQRKW
jgi:hypothetical protein